MTPHPLFFIRIGHDNKGGGAAWFLDKVIIECPALGRNWTFPANRWLAKNKGDNLLEVEIYPQDLATEEYMKCNDILSFLFCIYTVDWVFCAILYTVCKQNFGVCIGIDLSVHLFFYPYIS